MTKTKFLICFFKKLFVPLLQQPTNGCDKDQIYMKQTFRKLQNLRGGGAYLPANLIVTEFPAEQGFYATNDDEGPEGAGGGGEWGDPGDDEGPEPGGDDH